MLTAETMEISASLNKLVVVKGQAGSTTEAVLFRSIFCKIRWEQQVLASSRVFIDTAEALLHRQIFGAGGAIGFSEWKIWLSEFDYYKKRPNTEKK